MTISALLAAKTTDSWPKCPSFPPKIDLPSFVTTGSEELLALLLPFCLGVFWMVPLCNIRIFPACFPNTSPWACPLRCDGRLAFFPFVVLGLCFFSSIRAAAAVGRWWWWWRRRPEGGGLQCLLALPSCDSFSTTHQHNRSGLPICAWVQAGRAVRKALWDWRQAGREGRLVAGRKILKLPLLPPPTTHKLA